MNGIVDTRRCWSCGNQTRAHGKCSACGAHARPTWMRIAIAVALVVAIGAYLVVSVGR